MTIRFVLCWKRVVDHMDVIHRIQGAYSSLTRTQKRIADYLLQNSDKACFLSLKELSDRVQVSEVTIINFARAIGYENYTQLKTKLQHYISEKLSPSQKIATAISSLQQDGLSEIIEQEQQTLNQMLTLLETDDIKSAVALLKESRRVHTVSGNISKMVSDFIKLRLTNLGLDVVHFELGTFYDIASQLLRVNNNDVFIIVSFPQYSRRIITLVEYLRQRGNKMICITDKLTSPVAKHATVTFACPTYSPVFYNSITAPIALANILVSALALELKDEFKQNQQQVDQMSLALRQMEDRHIWNHHGQEHQADFSPEEWPTD